MYEMQGPRLAVLGIPADCPGELVAGAIGEPHPVRPTTGPGHLPEGRLPDLPAHPELLLGSSRLPPRALELSCWPEVASEPRSIPRLSKLPPAFPEFPPGLLKLSQSGTRFRW